MNVCILDVEESDAQFVNQIKQHQYEKEMEFYYCDYSVQIQLESIFPIECYPAIMLVDGNNCIIAKDQFYSTNWQQNIKSDSNSNNNNVIKQAKGLSLTAKQNEVNQSAYDQIYKQIKEKFLKNSKKKVTLFNCGQQLKQLAYPVSFELCISNQHILDWEGTFKQKIYNQPYLQHNISNEHIHYIQPLLDMIFAQASSNKFYKRIPDYYLQRGTQCAICNHQFTPLKEENQYFQYYNNSYYCETCFYDSTKRHFFYKNIIFIHFQAVLQSFNIDQFGLNIQEELQSNQSSTKPLEQTVSAFEQLQEENHQSIECIGCLQLLVGRRWICLSCDRSRESETVKNQINLCDSCQSLMRKKRTEERIPEKMFKSSEIFINIESMSHACNHITLGVSYFYGKNVF